jgi:hypothetical protein
MSMIGSSALLYGFAIALSIAGTVLEAADDPPLPDPPEANPARPTVSTPATLPPVGYLQFETGSLGATTSPEFTTRVGVGNVTKLAVNDRVEFFVQTEPYVHSTFGATAAQVHPGEVFVGTQVVALFGHDAVPTISLSYVRRLYESPAPELDSGTFRESGSLLLSNDMFGFHVDSNFIVLEQTDGGVRRAQLAQTLSVSHPLGPFTIAGELWHFTQPFLRSNAVGMLWAVSYPVRRNLVVDVGFDHGLTTTSTQGESFIGVTYLLPKRLWKD